MKIMQKQNNYKNNIVSISRVYGEHCGVTGRLLWTPLCCVCADGFESYLMRLELPHDPSDPMSDPQGDFIYLAANVPLDSELHDFYDSLQANDTVTVQYVVRTDTYLDADGKVYTKTFLNIQHIWRGCVAAGQLRIPGRGIAGLNAKPHPVQGETGPDPRYQSSHIHCSQNGRSQEAGC